MARSYARLMTSIWRNREFRNLDGGAQRVYLLLVTQPDITAAGTLALTVRRWADMAADTSVSDVTAALTTLAGKRFIAFDRETEELLVRSFVRWDGGYTNSKRLPVILRSAEEIASSALRQLLAAEFARLELPGAFLLDTPSDRASDGLSGGDDDPDGGAAVDPDPEAPFSQVDRLSDALSDAASASRSDSAVGALSVDKGRAGEPETLSLLVDALSDRPSPSEGVVLRTTQETEQEQEKEQKTPPTVGADAPTTQQLVASWIDTCRKRPPRNVIGQVSKNVKAMLEEGIDPGDIQAGLLEWARKSLHPSTLPSVVNDVMNGVTQPRLRAVSGGYEPFRSPVDQSVYDEEL